MLSFKNIKQYILSVLIVCGLAFQAHTQTPSHAAIQKTEVFPLILKDATKQDIIFHQEPRRIIALNPSATEVLSAIDRTQGLIAVTRFCPFPEFLSTKEKIGSVLAPDVEKIISLKPDIVFATIEGNREKTINRLRNANINVFVFNKISSFEDLYKRISLFGKILHAGEKSKDVVLEMRRRIGHIKKISSSGRPLKVFLQLGINPMVTANKNTILNEVIESAGGINIAGEALIRYPIYSREAVIADDPDIIIVVSMGKYAARGVKEWQAFADITAVRKGRVYYLDSNLICNIGPRLVDATEIIAGLLYPEGSIREIKSE